MSCLSGAKPNLNRNKRHDGSRHDVVCLRKGSIAAGECAVNLSSSSECPSTRITHSLSPQFAIFEALLVSCSRNKAYATRALFLFRDFLTGCEKYSVHGNRNLPGKCTIVFKKNKQIRLRS